MRLLRYPLFVFLLPVFFVIHGFAENSRFINFYDCLPLTGVYLLAALVIFLLCRLLLKDTIKAALLAAFILCFYFFFGALHDFLKIHDIFLHRYSILLPLFGAASLLLFFRLKKKRPSPRAPLFLNILLLIYLLADGIALAAHNGGSTADRPSAYPQPAGAYIRCDTCHKPDIYLIIFDEYSGNTALKDIYHYDNRQLDSLLTLEKFHTQRQSRSNYDKTVFSTASLLNFSYLNDIKDRDRAGAEDYSHQFESIRNNEVIHFLAGQGYTIINHSIFDLAKHPSPIDQPLIPTKTKLITDRTLINYIARDVGGWLEMRFTDAKSRADRHYRTNTQLLAMTIEESGRTTGKPKFVYTHVLMPHFPYTFDSLRRMRDEVAVATEPSYAGPEQYLGYLPYTNDRAKDLITAIKRNTNGKAVMLFMSDHGFRYSGAGRSEKGDQYWNQNNVYLPDGDYGGFYDSMTSVNQFRVLFNKFFHQRLPLLTDSTVTMHFVK